VDDTRWELRSALRWGSEHVGYYPTREAAEAEANKRIAATGSRGAIEAVVNGVVYFTEYEPDE
jgi:hypothetical protein